MGAALQKMQDDDTANPGMLFVQLGEQLWAKPAGAANKACADCHGCRGSMKGVARPLPRHSQGRRQAGRSRRPHQSLPHRQPAGRAVRAGEPRAAVARSLCRAVSRAASRSRRRTIRGSAPFREQGAEIYRRRQGQLNLSCAICHDDNAGKKLAGVTIPEAHPTGYPIYRLEWQALGSLKRRLRNCLVGIRAEAYAYDAPEYVALEIYLMDRARGMPLDAPGVRP